VQTIVQLSAVFNANILQTMSWVHALVHSPAKQTLLRKTVSNFGEGFSARDWLQDNLGHVYCSPTTLCNWVTPVNAVVRCVTNMPP